MVHGAARFRTRLQITNQKQIDMKTERRRTLEIDLLHQKVNCESLTQGWIEGYISAEFHDREQANMRRRIARLEKAIASTPVVGVW